MPHLVAYPSPQAKLRKTKKVCASFIWVNNSDEGNPTPLNLFETIANGTLISTFTLHEVMGSY